MYINLNCPHCDAPLELDYIKGGPTIFTCCECDNLFRIDKDCEKRIEELERKKLGNTSSGNRFKKYHVILSDNGRRSSRSSWNGFTDPDDFPTDGYDGGGW